MTQADDFRNNNDVWELALMQGALRDALQADPQNRELRRTLQSVNDALRTNRILNALTLIPSQD